MDGASSPSGSPVPPQAVSPVSSPERTQGRSTYPTPSPTSHPLSMSDPLTSPPLAHRTTTPLSTKRRPSYSQEDILNLEPLAFCYELHRSIQSQRKLENSPDFSFLKSALNSFRGSHLDKEWLQNCCKRLMKVCEQGILEFPIDPDPVDNQPRSYGVGQLVERMILDIELIQKYIKEDQDFADLMGRLRFKAARVSVWSHEFRQMQKLIEGTTEYCEKLYDYLTGYGIDLSCEGHGAREDILEGLSDDYWLITSLLADIRTARRADPKSYLDDKTWFGILKQANRIGRLKESLSTRFKALIRITLTQLHSTTGIITDHYDQRMRKLEEALPSNFEQPRDWKKLGKLVKHISRDIEWKPDTLR